MDERTLKQQIEIIEHEIDSLHDVRAALQEELRKVQHMQQSALVEELGIVPGAKLACILKTPNNMSILVKMLDIINVLSESTYFSALQSRYMLSSGESSVSVEYVTVSWSSLPTLKEEYDIFRISEDDFQKLQQKLCNLEITLDNVDQYRQLLTANS